MNREMEGYAAFTHGAIAFGNLLGLIWNVRRRNWTWAAIHAAGVAAHVYATCEHVREVRR